MITSRATRSRRNSAARRICLVFLKHEGNGEVGRARKSEVGSRKSEAGSRKSEVGSRKSEVGSRKSEVSKSEVSSPHTGARPKNPLNGLLPPTHLCNHVCNYVECSCVSSASLRRDNTWQNGF